MKPVLIRCLQEEGYYVYFYKPTLIKPLYWNMEPMTVFRRIRYLIEFYKGYRVYYLVHEEMPIGYCVVSQGGGRYSFSESHDIVVGPYFIKEECRGKRLSELLVGSVINSVEVNYRYAYVWIDKRNVASMRCVERLKFSIVCSASVSSITRQICLNSKGDGTHWIYRFAITDESCSNNPILLP